MTVCSWCTAGFTPRANGGKPHSFCSKDCRVDFDTTARSWAEQAVASGLLPASTFGMGRNRRARCSECGSALRGSPGSPKPHGALAADLEVAVGDEDRFPRNTDPQEQAHGPACKCGFDAASLHRAGHGAASTAP